MTWSVVVEQLGEVAGGQDEKGVRGAFEDYKLLSEKGMGRPSGRTVVLLRDGKVVDTFQPKWEGHSDLVKCPKCGNDELCEIRYAEDVVWWKLQCVEDDETLLIDGHYEVLDEGTTNPHLFCTKCSHSYPVPEKHEFV